jgi:hypothetical protein
VPVNGEKVSPLMKIIIWDTSIQPYSILRNSTVTVRKKARKYRAYMPNSMSRSITSVPFAHSCGERNHRLRRANDNVVATPRISWLLVHINSPQGEVDQIIEFTTAQK